MHQTRRGKARPAPSKAQRLQLRYLSQLHYAQEDERGKSVLIALRDFFRERGGAWSFVDLACGEGRMVLDVCAAFPECSGVGYDASREDVGMAISNSKKRGLDSRCYFRTRSTVTLDLESANAVLLRGPQAGANFMLRRVLPSSGLAIGSLILSLGDSLPENTNSFPFRWSLLGVVQGKPRVFCYLWMNQISSDEGQYMSDPMTETPFSSWADRSISSFSRPATSFSSTTSQSMTSHGFTRPGTSGSCASSTASPVSLSPPTRGLRSRSDSFGSLAPTSPLRGQRVLIQDYSPGSKLEVQDLHDLAASASMPSFPTLAGERAGTPGKLGRPDTLPPVKSPPRVTTKIAW